VDQRGRLGHELAGRLCFKARTGVVARPAAGRTMAQGVGRTAKMIE